MNSQTEGKQKKMRKLIGEGTFSRAYQTSENTVELVSICPAKECYALFSKSNPLAPNMEKDHSQVNTFKMPLYPHIDPRVSLNKRGLEIYEELRDLNYMGCGYGEFCGKINSSHNLTEEEKKNIISLASDVCNAIDPDDMRFEICPANVTCDSLGNLIMLDCFFSMEKLAEVTGY